MSYYYQKFGHSIEIRLSYRQSNRNYSIAFNCVRLVRLLFSFEIVRLTYTVWKWSFSAINSWKKSNLLQIFTGTVYIIQCFKPVTVCHIITKNSAVRLRFDWVIDNRIAIIRLPSIAFDRFNYYFRSKLFDWHTPSGNDHFPP